MSLASWLAPPLLPAVLVMVLFALVPRGQRLVVPVAVIGWATVWVDSHLTAEPHDIAGLAMVAVAMGMLLRGSRDKAAPGVSSDADHRE
jgi:hypothetical protein